MMQDLYNELTNPIPEFQEGGVIKYNAPTSVMLRASRMLKTLADTNDTNLILIARLQQREAEVLADLERAYNEIEVYRNSVDSVSVIDRVDVPASTEDASGNGV